MAVQPAAGRGRRAQRSPTDACGRRHRPHSNAAVCLSANVVPQGGSNINDVQAKTYARIQLSKANEYFPGTTERTLLVTGRLKQVGVHRALQPLGRAATRRRCGRAGAGARRARQRGCTHSGMGSRDAYDGWLLTPTACVPATAVPQVVAALGLVFAKLLREGVAPLSPRSKAAASYRQSNGSGSAGQGSDPSSGSASGADEPGADSASEGDLGGGPGSEAGSGGAPAPQRLLVRLLVPQPLCGVIIGKNGATIRQYASDTRTVIRVTSGEAAQVERQMVGWDACCVWRVLVASA